MPQNQPKSSQNEPFNLQRLATTLEDDTMARSNPSASPTLARPTLRESIDAGFHRYEGEAQEQGNNQKDWKAEQHGLNNLFCDNINRIDNCMDAMSQDIKELREGMQILLQRSEKSVSRPASHHSASSHRSISPPLRAAGLSTQQPH